MAGKRSCRSFVYDTPPSITRQTMNIRIASGRVIARRVKPTGTAPGQQTCHHSPRLPGAGQGKSAIVQHIFRKSWMRISILLLWTLCAAVSVIGPLLEARERSAERAVQDYAAAIAEGRVDDAIALIVPESRSDWRIFAEHQAEDRIRVLSAAVQRRALAADPRGWTVPRSVTVTG